MRWKVGDTSAKWKLVGIIVKQLECGEGALQADVNKYK
jgi:hypothetical protein